jgi:hypothetical protein
MPWSDCNLSMLVTCDHDTCKLKFIQPPQNEVLADITTTKEQLRSCLNIAVRPNSLARILFWIASGLHDYTPCLAIESSMQTLGFARFYRCVDRKGRNRIFAEVADQDHDGAIFILNERDYSTIEGQVQNIKNQGEQAASSNP